MIINAHNEEKKENVTLIAYAVRSGVNSVLNGKSIELFKEDNKENNTISSRESNVIDIETKSKELEELKSIFRESI